MELVDRCILLISPEPWDHIFVSKHHYAQHLAELGNKVFFLNPPSDDFRIDSTGRKHLKVVNYKGFPKGLRFMPTWLQRHFFKSQFERIQQLAGVSFDLVWSFDNSVFFDFKALPADVFKISHIVDLNQNFQRDKAATTADICFCTTRYIKSELEKFNMNTHFVHHGLASQKILKDVELPGKSEIKALYLGNLAMKYLDWAVIYKAAVANPEVDFIFIGSNRDKVDPQINEMHSCKKKLFEFPNVHFEEAIPSEMIASYMSKAQVLMVAYQEARHQDQANPHKVMEYLASGKPIVATFTVEFEQQMDLIQMSKSNADWCSVFNQTISILSELSSDERAQQRIAFAAEHTYIQQIERIKGILK